MQKVYKRIWEKAFLIPIKYFWQWRWETKNQTPTNSGEVRQSLKVPKDAARSTEHEKEEIETALMRNYQNSKKENKNVQMLLHYYMLKRRF